MTPQYQKHQHQHDFGFGALVADRSLIGPTTAHMSLDGLAPESFDSLSTLAKAWRWMGAKAQSVKTAFRFGETA